MFGTTSVGYGKNYIEYNTTKCIDCKKYFSSESDLD